MEQTPQHNQEQTQAQAGAYPQQSSRRTEYGVKALAVIGVFTVLVGLGWSAVSVAQYVPGAVSNLVSAAASITSQFFPADDDNGDGDNNGTSTPATSTPPTATTTDPTPDPDPNPTPQPNEPREPQAGEREEDIQQLPTNRSGGTGPADLAVSILEIGVIDRSDRTFVATATPSTNDRVGVRFQVKNVGGQRYTRDWSFNAALPTSPAHVYSSDTQRELGPGDRIEYTLGFDRADADTDRQFVVNIDPRNRLNDDSDDNNVASTSIEYADE